MRWNEGDMAQRPQTLVRQAVIVPVLLRVGQPHAAQRVGRIVGRYRDAVPGINRLAIGRAAAMRNPGPAAGAHYRLERRDEATRGDLHHYSRVRPVVDVRFPVGDHQNLHAGQFLGKQELKRSRRPLDLDGLDGIRRVSNFADQLAQFSAEQRNGARRNRHGSAAVDLPDALANGVQPLPQ